MGLPVTLKKTPLLLALGSSLQLGCTLITSPSDFSIAPEMGLILPDAGDSGAAVESGLIFACSAKPRATPCSLCLMAKCADQADTCFGDVTCLSYLGCSGVASCQTAFSGGEPAADAVQMCESANCPSCLQTDSTVGGGVGDPCDALGQCTVGLTCAGAFCSKTCASDFDCEGTGTSGENCSGQANRCALNEFKVPICFPGCAVDSDCTNYPGSRCSDDPDISSQSTRVCGLSAE
jgi:hypothetical protein